MAAQVIIYRTGKMYEWSIEQMRSALINLKPEMLALAPNTTATNYREISQHIFDILIWTNTNSIEI